MTKAANSGVGASPKWLEVTGKGDKTRLVPATHELISGGAGCRYKRFLVEKNL